MTSSTTSQCDLCGLPCRSRHHTDIIGGRRLQFCCAGCRMVYAMLMAASDSPDPASFTQSDLYRRCVAAGVVPSSIDDLRMDGPGRARSEPARAADSQGHTLALRFVVRGMWCPACAWVIEDAVSRLDGVSRVECDYVTDRFYCRFDPLATDPQRIREVVHRLGYTLSDARDGDERRLQRREFVRLMVCLLLSMNVMMLSWALYSGFVTNLSAQDIRYISWPIFVFATIAMVYGGLPLARKALAGLRAGAPGMESLVCLGAGSAYTYSLYSFFSGSLHLYFDTATMLITLVLLGKLLESRAKRNVRKDLDGFLALQPNKVRVCSDTFPEGRFAALGQLAPGDPFRVIENEVVAVDGRVVSGRATVDRSAVTGESEPVSVRPGHGITSGSRLIEGDLTIAATRVGDEALLGQMIRIVERSLTEKPDVETRSDRWLALFVPLMAGLALATTLVWHLVGVGWETAFVRGLTVLVIACPCSLGIAIPLARVAGIALAGRQGILVRDVEAFDRAGPVDCVVMDKTGTVTTGQWVVTDIVPAAGGTEDDLIALAAGMEAGVDHAVARAIAAFAAQRGISAVPVKMRTVEENGIQGQVNGQRVRFGAMDYLQAANIAVDVADVRHGGRSQLYLGSDGKLLATFIFGDRMRRRMVETVRALHNDGMVLHLVSGDGVPATEAVAHKLGIASWHAGMRPAEKATFVSTLQAAGKRVAMVGDGINDAPALAAADLSVAVHRHAALARQAAAVTLMRSHPHQLIDFLHLARRVNATVTQNLGCAWIYNLIGIPVAMTGWLNPLVAVVAMLLSSLTVIGNTLRLMRLKQR